jgi:hypothetical protein
LVGKSPITGRVREQAFVLARKLRAQFLRLPLTSRIVLSLFLIAAFLMALHTAFFAKDATLRLKVQHGFRSAQLSVWVDGDRVYSESLSGSTRKKFGLISEIQGTLSDSIAVPSGSHQVRVRIVTDDGSSQEETTTGDFPRHGQRTLAVNARRSDVSLEWQGAEVSASVESTTSSSSWMSGYVGTLLMTVAGSIVSALTGYIIKEFPKHLPSRGNGTDNSA